MTRLLLPRPTQKCSILPPIPIHIRVMRNRVRTFAPCPGSIRETVWKEMRRTCGIGEAGDSRWREKKIRKTALQVGSKTRPETSRQRRSTNQRRGRHPALTPATLEEKRGLCSSRQTSRGDGKV
ncbi:hypothetical protein NDU88_002183 [Pleurodeles waltl]|uniref:Uncharacterized protein n=1 Tax=Pleurodeles waltl TaxID=8319 RepID=A0AAV7VC42_PLEWA|nr:hypothetical protein NDU88_002183 [Pleurodeles waltl]